MCADIFVFLRVSFNAFPSSFPHSIIAIPLAHFLLSSNPPPPSCCFPRHLTLLFPIYSHPPQEYWGVDVTQGPNCHYLKHSVCQNTASVFTPLCFRHNAKACVRCYVTVYRCCYMWHASV